MNKNNTASMQGAEPQFALTRQRAEATEKIEKVKESRAGTFSRIRHRGGSSYLKDLRAVAGLSQQEMAILLGVGWHHIVNCEQRQMSMKPSARQHLIGLGRYWQDNSDLPEDAWATLFAHAENQADDYNRPDAEKHHAIAPDSDEDADPYGTAWKMQRKTGRLLSAVIGFATGVGATFAWGILV